ncbi:MAG: hypothetical protein GQ574_06130 [Crocinitomix sp.]|nr:hypothetical protein [Crocinitomix sp.]
MPTTITQTMPANNIFKPSLIQDPNSFEIFVRDINPNYTVGSDLILNCFFDIPKSKKVGTITNTAVRTTSHNNNNAIEILDLVTPLIDDSSNSAASRRLIEVTIGITNVSENIHYVTFTDPSVSGSPKKKVVAANANVQPDKKK